jgi:phenylacetate-CoA ligase
MIGEITSLWRLWRSRNLSPERLRLLQERKLRETVRFAFEQVPFYRDRFRAAGLDPRDIRTLEDLPLIPITTKPQLREAGEPAILARGVVRRQCRELHTSGSTGGPFRVLLTPADQQVRQLVEFRGLRAAGFAARDRLAVLGPSALWPPRLHNRLGLFRSEVVLGSLLPEEQWRRLQELAPDILWFYPTVLRGVLHAAGDRIRSLRPRLLISSSEVLDEGLRRRLVTTLGIAPYNFYGCMEAGRLAAECPAREGLHVNADHVVLESWADGRLAPPGQTGTALVTTLNTRAMPFLRYRLGDLVSLIERPCSCGCCFPLLREPQGRDDEMLRLPSGRLLSPLVLNLVLRRRLEIDHYRVIQDRQDHLLVQIAGGKRWPPAAVEELRQELSTAVGERLHTEVQFLESIPEEPGKFRTFVSQLSLSPPPTG